MQDTAEKGFRARPAWLLPAVAVLAAQAWLTARFFHADADPARLTDARPVVSGSHPLHLYHGHLGAMTWLRRGTTSCYDPGYQAGYPKTPVFDSGCRLAEVTLAAAGGAYKPGVYKLALAGLCLLGPLAVMAAARGAGLAPPACAAGGLAAVFVWWSAPVRGLLLRGDLDLLLAGLTVLVYLTWLIRFARRPGMDSWLVLTAAGCVGWGLQPVLWLAAVPLGLLYYLWVAPRQGVAWHAAFLAAGAVAVAVNAYWLQEWGRYWWLRAPAGDSAEDWVRPFAWANVRDLLRQFLMCPLLTGLVAAAGLGTLTCLGRRQLAVAALLSSAVVGLALLAAVGSGPGPSRTFDIGHTFALIGLLSVVPAAVGAQTIGGRVVFRWRGSEGWAGLILVAGAAFAAARLAVGPGLGVGMTPDQRRAVAALKAKTDDTGRVLWEQADGQGWTALLHRETGRPLIGGLAAPDGIEHMTIAFAGGELLGRPLANWPGGELARFVRRYNVGWVVCRSRESRDLWTERLPVRRVERLTSGRPEWLVELDRPRTYVLKGRAELVEAGPLRIGLKNVTPDADRAVVLSLHYQSRWRVSPSFVRVEPDVSADGPLPLLRLRVPAGVPRVALTWIDP